MQHDKKGAKIFPSPLKLQTHKTSSPWGKATAESLAKHMLEKSCIFMVGEVHMKTE